MKPNASKKRILVCVCLSALLLAASLFTVLTERTPRGVPQLILGDLICILVLCAAAMAFSLRESLRVTCYDYKNIALIGGILFVSVLVLVLFSYWISGFRRGGLSLKDCYQSILLFPRQFSYHAVCVILALCVLLAVSNAALIRREGFHPQNALSIALAGAYTGGTALSYFISDLLTEKVFIPRGLTESPLFLLPGVVIPLFLLLMLCYFECMLAGIALMGWKAARQKPRYDKDFIIILGCSIDKRGGLYPLLRGRVNRAVRFAWEQEIATGKPLKYVPSGGQGKNEIMSEGSAMEMYLLAHGAEDDEVFPEKSSKNTEENMRFSKALIDSLQPGARVAFATTNYHMLRSGILARMAGMDAEGIAGDTKWYFWPNGFVREIFAILKMHVRSHLLVALVLGLLCLGIGFLGYASHFLG